MYSKKNKNKNFAEEQVFCHQIFLELYGGDNPNIFL